MRDAIGRFLEGTGLPAGDLHDLPSSEKRFPDGAHYRIEIPSTEGPRCLEAVLEHAAHLHVPIHRVSQGSGVLLQTDRELDEMADLAASSSVEVSLFARPNAGWDTSAMALSAAGRVISPSARGADQLVDNLMDVSRAADHGFRSVLLADIGVLRVFGQLRSAGLFPPTMQAKVSVMLAAANPATARLLQDLGANTLNLPTDLDLAQIAAIRKAVDLPLDVYVEAPGELGGFIRLSRVADIIRVAAPVYVKLGLRNAPDIYPSGLHLESTAIQLSRERVRRARIALEIIERSGCQFVTSEIGASDLAIPIVTRDGTVGPSP